MTQGVLPFKYEEEKKDFCTTSLSGSLLYLDLLHRMGFSRMVRENLRAKEEKRGWSDIQNLQSLILLNICGGDCVDDIKRMEADAGLRRVMKHMELRHAFGRHRRQLNSQWRSGTRNAFPSPSSLFRYLSMFHNEGEESGREAHRAFIPRSNRHLSGLSGINTAMLEFLQLNNR